MAEQNDAGRVIAQLRGHIEAAAELAVEYPEVLTKPMQTALLDLLQELSFLAAVHGGEVSPD